MVAYRQVSACVRLELTEANPALIDDDAEKRELQLDTSILRHATSLKFDPTEGNIIEKSFTNGIRRSDEL